MFDAKACGISDVAELAAIEASTYPHFLDEIAILFTLNIVIMLIIGKIWPMETPYIQEHTKQVDITPWRFVKPVGIGIVVIVIGVYKCITRVV